MPGRKGGGSDRGDHRAEPAAMVDEGGEGPDHRSFIHDGPDADQMAVLKRNFSGVPDDMLLAAMKNMRPIFVRDARITEESVTKAGNFMLQTGVVTKLPRPGTNEFLPR
jgi:hypothetical protein